MEWNNPTAVSNQGLFRRMASKASTPADTVVTDSYPHREIWLNPLPINRPTSMPPQ